MLLVLFVDAVCAARSPHRFRFQTLHVIHLFSLCSILLKVKYSNNVSASSNVKFLGVVFSLAINFSFCPIYSPSLSLLYTISLTFATIFSYKCHLVISEVSLSGAR